MKKLAKLCLPGLALLLLLGGCTVRPLPPGFGGEESARPGKTGPAAAEPTPSAQYTVSYYNGDELLAAETVDEGAMVPAAEAPEGDTRRFVGWQDENGEAVATGSVSVTGDMRFTAQWAPALQAGVPFLCAEGGLFRPEDDLSRREGAELLHALMPEAPELPETLPEETWYKVPSKALSQTGINETSVQYETDQGWLLTDPLNPRTEGCRRLYALCRDGWLPAGEEGALNPEAPLAPSVLRTALESFYSDASLDAAFNGIAVDLPSMTRRETVKVIFYLTEQENPAAAYTGSFLDVDAKDPDIDLFRAASATVEEFYPAELPAQPAGEADADTAGETAQPAKPAPTPVPDLDDRPVILLSNGQLYCLDENGKLLKDADRGTLHFGPGGRYTSGDEQLDALTTEAIARLVNVNDSGERQLRAVYDYVRDEFEYLKGAHYTVGEKGWEIDEAKSMLSGHYGNCYCFAAAFWALSRGLGYDANAIAGQQGPNNAPHGWVCIELPTESNGQVNPVKYFFDVESEYAGLRDGARLWPLFKQPWSSSTLSMEYTYNWTIEGCA